MASLPVSWLARGTLTLALHSEWICEALLKMNVCRTLVAGAGIAP